MLNAFHKSNLDRPRARFGIEVAMRFLSPANPASRATPQRFAEYLSQAWYQPLLEWSEYRWEGDLVLLKNSKEAYQQVTVRSGPAAEWTSIRWILGQYATETGAEWRVESVFVQEPDQNDFDFDAKVDRVGHGDGSSLTTPVPNERPADIVLRVMRALRNKDDPYALHGCEVAIRHCSPSNAASRLSPQGFDVYLREPWYQILTEWEAIDLEDEEVGDGSGVVEQSVLVRREDDESWTVVNFQMSLHSGRWLMDSLSITE